MLKATLSLLLAGTLPLTPVSAQNAVAPEAAQLTKLKAQLAKFGTGKQTKLEVSLRAAANPLGKRSGYLREIKEESIVLMDAKTGANSELLFTDIVAVRKRGLSTGAKIALVGIGTAVLGVFIFFKTCGNPDVCG